MLSWSALLGAISVGCVPIDEPAPVLTQMSCQSTVDRGLPIRARCSNRRRQVCRSGRVSVSFYRENQRSLRLTRNRRSAGADSNRRLEKEGCHFVPFCAAHSAAAQAGPRSAALGARGVRGDLGEAEPGFFTREPRGGE